MDADRIGISDLNLLGKSLVIKHHKGIVGRIYRTAYSVASNDDP
jgi:hypothetical protein